jgi:photosystem II stability/assembly factor-like uncharacterized protein
MLPSQLPHSLPGPSTLHFAHDSPTFGLQHQILHACTAAASSFIPPGVAMNPNILLYARPRRAFVPLFDHPVWFARPSVLLLTLFLALTSPHACAQWTRMPGPEGGLFTNVVMMGPQVFALSQGGEFYRSTDLGETWALRCMWWERGTEPNLAVNGTTLYAGTETGLYRSVDSGKVWTAVLPYRIHEMEVTQDGVILAATDLTLSSHALHMSTDNGITWTPSDSGLTSNVFSMTFQGDTIFVGTNRRGVFRSTNGGKTWAPVNSGLPDDGYGVYQRFSAIVMRDSIVLASAESGFFRSTDAGAHWTKVVGLEASNAQILTEAEGEVIAGGYGLFASSDNGATWTGRYGGLSTLYVRALALHGSTFFAATDEGMARSLDRGTSWTQQNAGLPCSSIESIAFLDDRFFISDGKGSMSTDHGSTWQRFSGTILENRYVAGFTPHGTDLFVRRTDQAGIFRSTDRGYTWNVVAVTAHLLAAREGSDTLVAIGAPYGAEIVYRSTDGGTTWAAAVYLGFLNCMDMRFIGRDLFVLTGWGRVIRSTDMGDTWLEAGGGLDPNSMRPSALVACGSDLFLSTSGLGVLRSTNMGTSWTAVNNGMPRDAPNGYVLEAPALAVIGNTVIAGTYGDGIYATSDRGENWAAINEGLLSRDIRTMTVHGGNIYAGTWGMGVWWRPLGEITAVSAGDHDPLPSQIALEQNYPNPFNPSTTLRYALPRPAVVQLTAYDILGREVATLVNEQRPAGVHDVNFDASLLPGGVYFARLIGEGAVHTKKMLLLR